VVIETSTRTHAPTSPYLPAFLAFDAVVDITGVAFRQVER
jgi:hypothetical protein